MPETEIALTHKTLRAQQMKIPSWLLQFKQHFEPFHTDFYATLTPKEQRCLILSSYTYSALR
jgi:hypothetical protein